MQPNTHLLNTKRLLDAAVAEIAEHGPDAATVAAVARRAGLTTGALFARWSTKAALIAAAAVHARSLCGIPLVKRLDQLLRAAATEADWCLEPVAARAHIRMRIPEMGDEPF